MSIYDIIRPALKSDAGAIESLLNYKDHIHQHLDWRSPFDWLGEQPFFVLERDQIVQAALACPDDPPGVSWIRFFAALPHIDFEEAWHRLFSASRKAFSVRKISIASVAVQNWYLMLLLKSNFSVLQTIVVLHMNTPLLYPPLVNHEITIRTMRIEDLVEVTRIDQSSFKPLWQNSFQGTVCAFNESSYATVAIHNQQMVGYQISSSTPVNAHLARLAVLPEIQGRGIGTLLTKDMIRYFNRKGIGYITVNTQSDNLASLKVYKNIGFEFSGKRFAVLQYDFEDPTQVETDNK